MTDIGAWIPHGVLVVMAMSLGTMLWRVATGKGKELLDEVKAIRIELTSVDKKLGTFATIEALGRMGDRFDSRHQEMVKQMGVVERDIAVLKERKGRVK